jgi:hypothetical protein
VENPWARLPRNVPFVLPEDERAIDVFNRSLSARDPRDPRCIDTTIPPEPFLGCHEAQLLVLLANPGRDPRDDDMFRQPQVAEANRTSMVAPGAPIYNLADKLSGTPSGAWWRSALKGLRSSGRDYSDLAERIFVVEFHGYHSQKASVGAVLPSQQFGFRLVAQAIRDRKVIIVSSASNSWHRAVPGLASYDLKVTKRSPQSRALSKGNLGDVGFRLVSAALDI